MSQLDPTYKFFLEASVVVLVLFLLVVLVAGTVFVAWRWIRYSENALKAKREGREADDKAKQTDMELEEMRLKMVGELATQISKLSERISDDREQDRLIREKELKAVDRLVESVDNTTNLLKDHTETSLVFRTTMTTQSATMLSLIGDANKGIADNTTAIHSVKTELDEFKQALIALPNTIQAILNPYCERMESALQKLETVQVEEKHHVHAEKSQVVQPTRILVDDSLAIHPSNGDESTGSATTQPIPSGDEDANGNTTTKSDTGSPTDVTSG